MEENQDIQKFLEESKRKFKEYEKRRLEEARNIAKSIIPSIKEDLGDNSLEITIENQDVAGRVTGPNSFSLNYSRFLPDVFGDKPNYDDILGLAQHEKVHLDKNFPNTVMREVMVDMTAAERYGPYALFSFQSKNIVSGDFTSPWLYSLGSLVNLKPFLSHKSQKRFVENALRTNYPHMLCDMLGIIDLEISKLPKDRMYESRKLGDVIITSQIQDEMEKLFSKLISGLYPERKHIEISIVNPFSPLRRNPQEYISDYKKLEDSLVL